MPIQQLHPPLSQTSRHSFRVELIRGFIARRAPSKHQETQCILTFKMAYTKTLGLTSESLTMIFDLFRKKFKQT